MPHSVHKFKDNFDIHINNKMRTKFTDIAAPLTFKNSRKSYEYTNSKYFVPLVRGCTGCRVLRCTALLLFSIFQVFLFFSTAPPCCNLSCTPSLRWAPAGGLAGKGMSKEVPRLEAPRLRRESREVIAPTLYIYTRKSGRCFWEKIGSKCASSYHMVRVAEGVPAAEYDVRKCNSCLIFPLIIKYYL